MVLRAWSVTATIAILIIGSIAPTWKEGTVANGVQHTDDPAFENVNFGSFGRAVDIDRDTAVVGAPSDRDPLQAGWQEWAHGQSGVVHVYERQVGGGWEKVQALVPDPPVFQQGFGGSVALHGNLLLVGVEQGIEPDSNGTVAYLFARTPTGWAQVATIPSWHGNTTFKGVAVALGDGVAAVGDRHGGAAFAFPASQEGLGAPITLAGAFGPTFGHDVAVAAGKVAVAAPGAGVAVFDAATGSLETWLADEEPGSAFSVAMQEKRLVVGSDGQPFPYGRVRVYEHDGAWSEKAVLTAPAIYPQPPALTGFGHDVDLDGETLAVGAPLGGVVDGGATFLFYRGEQGYDGPTILQGEQLDNDQFGAAVALDCKTVLIGSPEQSVDGAPLGAAHWLQALVPGTNGPIGRNVLCDAAPQVPHVLEAVAAGATLEVPVAHHAVTFYTEAPAIVAVRAQRLTEPQLPSEVPHLPQGDYVMVEPTQEHTPDAIAKVRVEMRYNETRLAQNGTEVEELGIHYWNGTTWVDLHRADRIVDGIDRDHALRLFEAGHDETNRSLYVVVDHTSLYALAPRAPAEPVPVPPSTYAFVAMGVMAVLAVGIWATVGWLKVRRAG